MPAAGEIQSRFPIDRAIPLANETSYAPARAGGSFFHWLDNIWTWLRHHPFATAGILAASGAGLLLAGPVLATAGVALSAMGGTLAAGATASGLVVAAIGVIARQFPVVLSGLVIAGGGALIGAAISLIGAIVAAAGAFLTGIGWIALAGCLLLVLKRGGEAVWSHREEIAALLQRIRGSLKKEPLDESAAPERITLPSDPARSFTVDDLFSAVEAECNKVGSAMPAPTR